MTVADRVAGVLAFDVGALRCHVVSDGSLSAPASFLFASADPGEVAPLLAARGLDPEAVPAGINCLVVDAGGTRLLWDTGTGGRWHEGTGKLGLRLEAAGLDPESVDLVLLSHGHPDHIGGLVAGGGQLRFRRARYLIAAAEWDHWTTEGSLARLDPAWVEVARAVLPAIADRTERFDGELEVADGVRLLPAPGHTPGHLALELESRGERLLCVGDAFGHPLNVERPDWLVASDGDPFQTPQTRRGLLERASRSDALVFANHFVFPGLGWVRERGGGYLWVKADQALTPFLLSPLEE